MKKTSFLLLFFITTECIAVAPGKTNINNVTTLFEDNVEQKDKFIGEINALKESGVNGIKSKQAESMVPNIAESNLESESLSSLRVHELDDMARTKRTSEECKHYDSNGLELDYTSASVKREKKDIDEILEKRDKDINFLNEKMEELTKGLKQFEIDCKTEKGPIVKEPEFNIDIKREDQRNIDYDQFFCEKPRNTYNCHDSATITCLKRNWRYFEWKDGWRDISIGGFDARGHGWLYSIKWKKKRFGLHMRGDGGTQHGVRHWIAHRINANAGQIGDLQINARGDEPIHHAGGKEYVFDKFNIKYRYRDAEEICDKWSEPDWTERCHIK